MAEPHFSDANDDDLPRTLRRAKQERAREAQDGVPPTGAGTASPPIAPSIDPSINMGAGHFADDEPYFEDDDRVTVARFDVPFFRLMLFFIKCVFAAMPALIVLGALLYGAGQILKLYFPWLVQAQILIQFPNN